MFLINTENKKIIEALKREVREETSLDIFDIKLLFRSRSSQISDWSLQKAVSAVEIRI